MGAKFAPHLLAHFEYVFDDLHGMKCSGHTYFLLHKMCADNDYVASNNILLGLFTRVTATCA